VQLDEAITAKIREYIDLWGTDEEEITEMIVDELLEEGKITLEEIDEAFDVIYDRVINLLADEDNLEEG